jgi:hypothetical protein
MPVKVLFETTRDTKSSVVESRTLRHLSEPLDFPAGESFLAKTEHTVDKPWEGRH